MEFASSLSLKLVPKDKEKSSQNDFTADSGKKRRRKKRKWQKR
jgi:hypothetical protein